MGHRVGQVADHRAFRLNRLNHEAEGGAHRSPVAGGLVDTVAVDAVDNLFVKCGGWNALEMIIQLC